jgi:hypothetical protein
MNTARGETALIINGTPRRLCLTLGALAELEGALKCASLAELESRLRAASPADWLIVLQALLRGGGEYAIAANLARADIAPGEAARAIAEAFERGLGT